MFTREGKNENRIKKEKKKGEKINGVNDSTSLKSVPNFQHPRCRKKYHTQIEKIPNKNQLLLICNYSNSLQRLHTISWIHQKKMA